MRNLGRALAFRIAYQADAATTATTGWIDTPIYEVTPPADPGIQDDPLLGASMQNQRDPIQGVRELFNGMLKVTAPLDLAMMGHWLRMVFGAGTEGGSTPNYTHTFGSGLVSMPYVTIQVAWQSGDVGIYVGCLADMMSFNISKAAAYQQVELTFRVKSWSYATAVISDGTAATALTALKLAKFVGIAKWAGTTMADLLDLTFTYSNNLEPYNTVSGDAFPLEFDTGIASISGTMRLRHKDRTFRQISIGDTAAALVTSFAYPADATNKLLQLTMANTRLTAQGPAVTGPGGIEESFNFRVEQTASVKAVVPLLKNATAGSVFGY